MNEIGCAANETPGFPPCTRRDEHTTTCAGDCSGCAPRPAIHGYLCRRHYEQWEQAWADVDRLRGLLLVVGNGRALQADSSASTHAGPRVPLSALQLDLDAIDRAWQGDPTTHDGAIAALQWAHETHLAGKRHPTEPKRERLHRVRCASCRQVAVVLDPPALPGGDTTLRCVSCGWQTRDQDHAEAAAHAEALVRDPYRPRGRTRLAGDDRAGIARLVDALR